jgi:hypothetical protein
MPTKRKRDAILLALVALAALALAAPTALAAPAAPAHYEGASAGGGVVVFSTTEPLVPGDTDLQRDVYVRELDEALGHVTRQVSLGPTGGNDSYVAQFQAVDAAGDRVFFSTKERLTAEDTDSAEDVYVRDLLSNKTTLVSAGDPSCSASKCGHANLDASAVSGGVAGAGDRVFFVSFEQLSSQDKDEGPDLYVRDLEAGTTTLVSTPAPSCSGCGAGTKPVVFQGASADGTKAIFTTVEPLVGEDKDVAGDLYERDLSAAQTELVSTPGTGPEACPAGSCEPSNSTISASGAHVFFETSERIAVGDSDKSQDVYDWSAGVATRASTGAGGGNGEHNATLFRESSESGAAVFFATDEKLAAADTDEAQDVYVRSGSETELVSIGDGSCTTLGQAPDFFCEKPATLNWVAPGGTIAVLSSQEPLLAADKDESVDLYARTLGPSPATTLVSQQGPTCGDPECGNGEDDATFAGASANGAHLFFTTPEALAPPAEGEPSGPGDRDERTDVYDRSGGATAWVSAGQLSGGGLFSGNGAFDAFLQGSSGDGASAFLTTGERLTEADHDAEVDVYERSPGGTLLVSQGNDPELEAELAPPVPVLEGTHPESPAASTEPDIYGSEPLTEASIKLYTTPGCSGEPVATGSGEELEEGIAATVASGSTTSFRATAEAEGFISSCSAAVVYRQVEPPIGEEGGGGGGTSTSLRPGSSPKPPGPLISLLVTPQTRITFGPAFKTRLRRPVFRFADATGQAGTTFLCELDRQRWKGCTSPFKLPKLGQGRHVFGVKGVNAVGVAQPQPTKRSFKVAAR